MSNNSHNLFDQFTAETCQRGDIDCTCSVSGYCYRRLMNFKIRSCPCSCRSSERYAVFVHTFNRAGLVSERKEITVSHLGLKVHNKCIL